MINMKEEVVKIIGAGLAGCEAAYQLAKRGVKVELYEAKPKEFSPSHSSANLAELVCSNSLKSDDLSTASGLLKHELRLMGSLCIKAADNCRVDAGGALAVDRELFSKYITDIIKNHPNIQLIEQRIDFVQNDVKTIVATGPLTLSPLLNFLAEKLGDALYFYDAAAPIITADSIDYSKTFIANRYNKGDGVHINCPLTKEEYDEFVTELTSAKTAALKEFEVFESCMPVEIMASRGHDTLRFGPLKPVGLYDKNGKRPYAVLQLRRENAAGQMYNLIGFQTNLTFSEQRRVFGIIPALKNAEYLRYGVMHRNSFINAPKTINNGFSCINNPNTFIAGQLSGVEGYCESIMSGLVAALNLYYGKEFILPTNTMSGALCNYLTLPTSNFQPMNANFGLLPLPEIHIRDKRQKRIFMSNDALNSLSTWLNAW